MKQTTQKVLAGVSVAMLSTGCLGPGREEDGLEPLDETGIGTRHAALVDDDADDDGNTDTGTLTGDGCYLVVYEPVLVSNWPVYMTQSFAYVSCSSWKPQIDLTVTLKKAGGPRWQRHVNCTNTATCMSRVNAHVASGYFRTSATASTRNWNGYNETEFVPVSP